MGDASTNSFVPFQITYINTDNPIGPFKPMNPEITPCNKSLNVSKILVTF